MKLQMQCLLKCEAIDKSQKTSALLKMSRK